MTLDTRDKKIEQSQYVPPQHDMMTKDLAKIFNHADFSTSMIADNKMNHIY